MKKLFGAFLALFASAAFSATLVPVQLLNPTGSSSGQAIVSTGASSAPAWGGIGVNGIASIAANTVLANATGSSASPTAFAMPSCATALKWISGTGFTCNTAGAFTTLSGSSLAKVYATKTSAQSMANNAATTITSWTTGYDVNSNFTASTGTFTAPATGYYLISAQVCSASGSIGAGSIFAVNVIANSVVIAAGESDYPAAGTSGMCAQVTVAASMSSSQTATISVFQASGAAINTATGTGKTYLSISQFP